MSDEQAIRIPLTSGAGVSYADPRIARTLWKTPVATIVTRAANGLILEANDAFCRLFGHKRGDIIGKRTVDLHIWADPETRDRVLSGNPHGSNLTNIELDYLTASGEVRSVLSTIVEVEIDGHPCLIGQMYDLTERKQTEDRLRLLDRIARIGYESGSYSEILERSLAEIHQLFCNDRVGFGSIEQRVMTIEATAGPPEMQSVDGVEIDLSAAPEYERALMRGEGIAAPDVREDVRFREFSRSLLELGVYAVLDVPVRRDEETVGVLFLEASEPTNWSAHCVSTLTEIAALLAVSLFRARAEEELRHERELIQTVMDYVPDFLYVKDASSRFTRVNKAVAAFHGFDNPDDFIGKTDFDLFPESLAKQFMADEQHVIASGESVINRLEPQNIERSIWTLTSTVPFRGADGAVLGIVGTSRDVSEREAMEAALRTSESRQRALLEAIPDVVFRIDREGNILDFRANRQSSILDDPNSKPGCKLTDELPIAAAGKIIAGIEHSLDEGVVTAVEYEVERDELTQTFEMRIAPCGDHQVVAITRDVTERKMLETRLAHQATHDPLTGLPNRNLFATRLNEALESAREGQTSVAVLFIDLDNFKHVNDTFGHAAGDRMLSAISDSIRRSIRSADTVARIGGDEFAVLLEELPAGDEAQLIASRISRQIATPIRIGRSPAMTTASIGIAVGVPDRDSAESLLDNADHAMYEAKRAGKRGQSAVIRLGPMPYDERMTQLDDLVALSEQIDTDARSDFPTRMNQSPPRPLRYLRPKVS